MLLINKKLKYDYTFIDTLECGVSLVGSEVKPIKNKEVSLVDAYCYFVNHELYLKGLDLPNKPTRDKKLLLNKRELFKLKDKLVKGLTIVPYKLYLNDKGLIKISIVLAKGKKKHDKRNDLRLKEHRKEITKNIR